MSSRRCAIWRFKKQSARSICVFRSPTRVVGSKRKRSGSATRLRTLEISEFSFACTLPWATRGATRAQRGSSRCLLSTTRLNRFIRDAISRVIRWLRSDGRVDKPSDSECMSLANLPKSTQIYPNLPQTNVIRKHAMATLPDIVNHPSESANVHELADSLHRIWLTWEAVRNWC